jgi:hypothetical protein
VAAQDTLPAAQDTLLAHPDPSLAFIVEVDTSEARSRALTALGYATETPPLCFLLEEAQPGRA